MSKWLRKGTLEHMRTAKIQTRLRDPRSLVRIFAVRQHQYRTLVEDIGLIAKILTRRVGCASQFVYAQRAFLSADSPYGDISLMWRNVISLLSRNFVGGCGITDNFEINSLHFVLDFVFNCPFPVSILRKSISGRHRPVRVADGPMTARCRFT